MELGPVQHLQELSFTKQAQTPCSAQIPRKQLGVAAVPGVRRNKPLSDQQRLPNVTTGEQPAILTFKSEI